MLNQCCVKDCENALFELEKIAWKEKLEYKPKLRTYVQIKASKETEKYVKMNLSCRERSLLAQIRIGILPLHLETGRYRNVPIDQRYCFHCKNEVENEFHFIFNCPLYANYRIQLFDVVRNCSTNFDSMNEISKMIYLCDTFSRQFAKFLCRAYDYRQ